MLVGVIGWAWQLATPALAAPPSFVELEWAAPDRCSSAADVLAAITTQLGENFSSETRIRAAGIMHVAGGMYVLELRYSTEAGGFDERRVEGESCRAATDAAALVLALALDPAKAAPPPARPSATAAARPDRSAFIASVLGEFDSALLGLPTFAPGVRFGWRYEGLELSASFQYFLPREHSNQDIALRLQLLSFDVGACYLVRSGGWAFGPCGRFEIGRLSGNPSGAVDAGTPGSARAHAATLGGTLRLPLSAALRLAFDAGFEWVSRRPQFQVTGAATIAHPSTFGLRLALGPALVF